jgi:hypothetical protein
VPEQLVHDCCSGRNNGPNLVSVDQLGDVGSAVADQLRDLLGRHAGVVPTSMEPIRLAQTSYRAVDATSSSPGIQVGAGCPIRGTM